MDNPQFLPGTQPVVIHHHNQVQEKPELEVPARVKMAFSCLTFLSFKMGKKIAVADATMADFPGEELELEERELLLFSAKTLTAYVTGKLEPNKTEQIAEERYRTNVDGLKLANDLNSKRADMSVRMDCPVCSNHPMKKPGCGFCGGSGYVRVSREAEE